MENTKYLTICANGSHAEIAYLCLDYIDVLLDLPPLAERLGRKVTGTKTTEMWNNRGKSPIQLDVSEFMTSLKYEPDKIHSTSSMMCISPRRGHLGGLE
jgi:hypothetical protein